MVQRDFIFWRLRGRETMVWYKTQRNHVYPMPEMTINYGTDNGEKQPSLPTSKSTINNNHGYTTTEPCFLRVWEERTLLKNLQKPVRNEDELRTLIWHNGPSQGRPKGGRDDAYTWTFDWKVIKIYVHDCRGTKTSVMAPLLSWNYRTEHEKAWNVATSVQKRR